VTPDPKQGPRIRDLELLTRLHTAWRGECVLADMGDCFAMRYSLHHVLNKPRDDVEANLVMTCGDGVAGHHGLLTAEDEDARRALGAYLTAHRPDTMAHLALRLGGSPAAAEWLCRRLYVC